MEQLPKESRSVSDASMLPQRRGAVAVIMRHQKLLVIRRSHQVVAPGAYCFPGGGIEPGETEAIALVRELREELGVTVEPLRKMWSSVTPWNVELAWWRAALADDADLAPNPDEVESVHWYTLAEMRGLSGLLSSNRDFLDQLQQGTIHL
jgi:8-oxo-dGTP pyrophosphatase MutT (NUDIX family)